jgi:hypothetical protein
MMITFICSFKKQHLYINIDVNVGLLPRRVAVSPLPP